MSNIEKKIGQCLIKAETLKAENAKLAEQINSNEAEVERLVDEASKLIQMQAYTNGLVQ